jgi:hypothetical protein
VLARADGFKFRLKNTAKTNVAVYYKVNKRSGGFKVKALLSLKPGEEKIREVSLSKGDTIAFYGQDAENNTSVMVKKVFARLNRIKTRLPIFPLLFPKSRIPVLNRWRG